VTRSEKARRIADLLDQLYPDPAGPLTDSDGDPYQLLIKVLLSAQCTDARVNQVAPGLFARARRPQDMVRLRVSTIEDLIRPCGLAPAKAAAIHGLSALLLERHRGQVPQTFAELEALPGVGHKTASVVMGQAFGAPAFPVDTHIHRLAGRWGLSPARNVSQTERDLKKLFAAEHWHRVHLQFIFFGREYCPARRHDLATCPICSWAASKKRIRDERRAR
jgi:endonuclease III